MTVNADMPPPTESQPKRVERWRLAAPLCAAVAILIGAIALGGWAPDVPVLK
jgi:hypothetical protein